MKRLQHPLVVVAGPTASGKTELAQRMAERLSGAVLSADSMQIYRGMDIGTGKIAPDQRTVAYFGLDIADPGEPYSASRFQDYGRAVVEQLDADGQRCIVCGGTGFYIRALIDCFDFPAGEQVGNPVRDSYTHLAATDGPQAVWNALFECDPQSAALIPVNDTKRVIRALELFEAGESYAAQKERFSCIEPYYPTVMIGLAVDADVLVQRIDERVDSMVRAGLVDEVAQLCDGGYAHAITSAQAIGYKEIVAYLEGECTLEAAIARIKTATRQYAKRQRTWFRKEPRIQWIEASQGCSDSVLQQALALCEQAQGGC